MTPTLFQSSPPIKTNKNVVTTLQISSHLIIYLETPPPQFFPSHIQLLREKGSNVIYSGLGLGLENTTYLLLDALKLSPHKLVIHLLVRK